MNIVSISTSESLKSKILRRVREGETVHQDKQGQDQFPETELASERMNATGQDIVITRKQSLTRRNSQLTSPQKTGDNLRSLRSSSRTQVGQSPQKGPGLHEGNKGRARVSSGVPRARCSRGRQKAQFGRVNREAIWMSSPEEGFGDSKEAMSRPTPVKRRLRSATSLVAAPLDKVRRVESAPNLSEPSRRSPSPNRTKVSLVVPESPCCLMIVEKKSPKRQRKILVKKSAEAFCACTDGASYGTLRSIKSGTKKSNIRQNKRKLDSCPGTGTSSKKMRDKLNLSRNGVSKQKKKISRTESHLANRPTRSCSKTKAGKISQVKRTSGSKDELIDSFKIQDYAASNSVVAAMSSVLSQPSSETVGKESGSIVRELINERINITLTTRDDQNDEDGTTNAMTVTKTAATEAAKAVGGISLMPLFKAASPDFLPTVSSPSTPTMTVMKASSDPIVSPTMSSESNLKNQKTQESNGSEAPQLLLVSTSMTSGLQAVAQCKCVASVSTVPTPSLKDVGSTGQAGQPIFLSQEAFQFQNVSYPGMFSYNLPDVNPSGRLPKSSKASKKRGTTKKKSVEKEPQSLVSSENASSSTSPINVFSASTSSPPNPDTKDPSLDDNGEKIKRPMNAFMIWSRQQRSILASEIPKMTNAEISVKLGVMWNDLDYSVKQKYFDEAIQLKLQHRKDYPDWVYQPRPQKRQRRRRKHQPNPYYRDVSQQMPFNQMVLVMPDGQRILCPAIPQQNCQGPAPMMTNFANNLMPGPAVDGIKLKNVSQPNKQKPKSATTSKKDANIMPKPPLNGTDVKNSASGPGKQSKSEMVVLMPDGTSHQVLMCPVTSQQNCKESRPAMMTNITSTVISGPQVDTKAVQKSIDKQHPKQSEMVLVTPDGKQVLCPVIQGPSTEVKDEKKSANQPSEQSKSSKEKLVTVRSENSRKCGEKECMITFKGKAGLSNPGPINLGPVIQLSKNVTSSTKEMAAPSVYIPEVKTVSSDSHSRQLQMAGREKKFVTLLQMALGKDRLGTSKGQTDPMVIIPQTKVQSNTSKATERKAIEAKPFPIVNNSMARVQDGNNQSIAKTGDTVMMMLSNANQNGSLTEISALLRQPVNNGLPTQNVSVPLKKMENSSKPHPADHSSGSQRQPVSVDDSSRPFLPDDSSQRFVPGDSSQFHPAVKLVPLNLQEPDLQLQPLIKDTGVQTLQDWSSSCSSNNNQNIVKLSSHLPSSILKNQPTDMVWNTDPRIAQLPNISHKGTSTVSSYPFYFTPIQQASGVPDGSTAPLLNPPALPATVDTSSCMVPLSTASLTDIVPTDVSIPSTQFADTPTLCEISEPDRLLESLAMSGVEISEDEAEETENLFQRVMNMVSD